MTINEDEENEVFGYDDFNDSAYRMKDIVFDIMLSGVTSFSGIAMELNRHGHYGREWKPVDVRRLLAGD